ncbi:MAG: hypothetical protein JSW61_00400 [Candidatus Thorarchaeota archaeon]|nr:MAG: hypothetical protein JSW61_00400 [Candidatus Thorarchaeota archaeon]
MNSRNPMFALLALLLVIAFLPPSHSSQTVVAQSHLIGLRPDALDSSFVISGIQGTEVEMNKYVVVELLGSSIPGHGLDMTELLTKEGIVATLLNCDEIAANPYLLEKVPVVILDASIGSSNGTEVDEAFINTLVLSSAPLVLMGRASWILHRLRDQSPPSKTAFSDNQLIKSSEYEDAVFLSYPNSIEEGALLTNEAPIPLPVDMIQSAKSRLVNLTGSSNPQKLSSLRFDSWPLDALLIGLEDPSLLTTRGVDFVANIVGFASSIRESPTSSVLADLQSGPSDAISGAFSYVHEPTVDAAYFSVRSIHSLLNDTEKAQWTSYNQKLVEDILISLYEESDTEAGFRNSLDYSLTFSATARGLWLMEAMGISSSFDEAKVVNYLAARQGVDGGFANDISTTYTVIEALNAASALGAIDTSDLENWLRSCVVTGAKSNDSSYWGGVAVNPYSFFPKNTYAAQFVISLDILGETHNDPNKLTEWIIEETANADGSYYDSVYPSSEVVLSTSYALSTMHILGTLNSENQTSGLAWLSDAQLPSGGFGLHANDGVGKTRESSLVAQCLSRIDPGSEVSAGLVSFVDLCKTDVGFENMEPVPSLMWTSWAVKSASYSHPEINKSLLEKYLESFSRWEQYPNTTPFIPPEYSLMQYYDQSTWAQLLAVSTAKWSGITLSAARVSETSSYIGVSQHASGHYRPTQYMGTEHMQYTVAAVEALSIIDKLSTINYRNQLESVVMVDYSSGTWEMSSWTLRPFAGHQQAIDWLCTRAAFRLDLINESIASEIESQISSRVQYDDLWLLSRDVATLALLNSSFSVSLGTINETRVLEELSSSFTEGWYNTTSLWQPVFTADVLEMASILGLRIPMREIQGTLLSVNANDVAEIGQTLSVSVANTSTDQLHTVYVNGFDSWFRFDNVTNVDSLDLQLPSKKEWLGECSLSFMTSHYGDVRAFSRIQVNVTGSLQGLLELTAPPALIGDRLNGTVSWTLETGADAGLTDLRVRLGDEISYQEWLYPNETSPFALSVPTIDFDPGSYNITVELVRTWCGPLILGREVTLEAPHPTYILAQSSISGHVGLDVLIDWSLHLQSNDSILQGQVVTLDVNNSTHSVFTDSKVSQDQSTQFVWNPCLRGNYTFLIKFARNGTLDSSIHSGILIISENSIIIWHNTGTHDQYSTHTISVELVDESETALEGFPISLRITTPTSSVLFDDVLVTNSSGYVSFSLQLAQNGVYGLSASFLGSSLLNPSSSQGLVVSWSYSELIAVGIPQDTNVGLGYSFEAQLVDSIGMPIAGSTSAIRITLLPSLIVYEEDLLTNATGFVSYQWFATSPGTYRLEAIFAGTLSRGAAAVTTTSETRVPVTLTILTSSLNEVSSLGWVAVEAQDHGGTSISGLMVSIELSLETGQLLLNETGVTVDGVFNVTWIPSRRGAHIIDANAPRQGWYDTDSFSTSTDVYELPIIIMEWVTQPTAPSICTLVAAVYDIAMNGISGVALVTTVTLDSVVLLETANTTDDDGRISFDLILSAPGSVLVAIEMASQGWLLACWSETSEDVLGLTGLQLSLNGQPVEQGTTLSIIVTLMDWEGNPLEESSIDLTIDRSNGSLALIAVLTTGIDGRAALAHDFHEVDDYIIRAFYSGDSLNSSAEATRIQRVYVTPRIVLISPPTSLLGNTVQLDIGLLDALGVAIAGRVVNVSITLNDITVFTSQFISLNGLQMVHWDPAVRGLATIQVRHTSDAHYLYNTTLTTISILEIVDGSLQLSSQTLDLFESVTLNYTLIAGGVVCSVDILFEVLAPDLVPLWTTVSRTDGVGHVSVNYMAVHHHGLLVVQAAPLGDQYLVGGDELGQMTVMTECNIQTVLSPTPVSLDGPVTISLILTDELGYVVDSLDVHVALFDPYDVPIRLGIWTDSVMLTVQAGSANVSFAPTTAGLHRLVVVSSGSPTVHSFTSEDLHTVHSPSILEYSGLVSELSVGDTLQFTVSLRDFYGNPLVGCDIQFLFDGPGALRIGPVALTTNTSGLVTWVSQIDTEGLWEIWTTFTGVGVYLPSTVSRSVDVRFGTVLRAQHLESGEIVANVTEAVFSVLLEDSAGTPLEGFTIRYEVYHESAGLIKLGSFTQTGQLPETVEIVFARMGNYTVVFLFDEITHYRSSTAAVVLFALGTSELRFPEQLSWKRSENATVAIEILDEVSLVIPPVSLDLALSLIGPFGNVSLASRLMAHSTNLSILLYALPVGSYVFTAIVRNSSSRIGCSGFFTFNVTTSSKISVSSTVLSGLVGDLHSITLRISDSLNERILGIIVTASLYNPSGLEILGSPLRPYVDLSAENGTVTIQWIPSLAGTYSLEVSYPGDAYTSQSFFVLSILARLESLIELEVDDYSDYGDSIEIRVVLSGGNSRIVGALVELEFARNGTVVAGRNVTTDLRGSAIISLSSLPAGHIALNATFPGTDVFARCSVRSIIAISPRVEVLVPSVENAFRGENCSLAFKVQVGGLAQEWSGDLSVVISGPNRYETETHSECGIDSEITLFVVLPLSGDYLLTATVSGLPVINMSSFEFVLIVTDSTEPILMDAGSAPVIGGGALVALVGVFVRRRLQKLLDDLPTDWE